MRELFVKHPIEDFFDGGFLFFSGFEFAVKNILYAFKTQINEQVTDFISLPPFPLDISDLTK